MMRALAVAAVLAGAGLAATAVAGDFMVVPADQLDAATLDMITRATRGSALSKAMGKQGFYQQIGLPQDQAYAVAGELMAQAAMTSDAQEAFKAFLEKRPAKYKQRPSAT